MCRFLCYLGPPVLLADWLYHPGNSLILQSFKARERVEPLNGDGFGVGWYAPEISSTPCVFTSVTPAWSNQNLRNLADHIKSPCFFAHVRAASPGMRVAEANCHPFQYGRYLWMHNGAIEGFQLIKRGLRESLTDHLYEAIEGTTDSEHAFMVFLNLLGDTDRVVTAKEIGDKLVKTVLQLERCTAAAGVLGHSYYNFTVTDGHSIAALRYVSDPRLEPISLYYSSGPNSHDGVGVHGPHVIIASERLTEPKRDWIRVAPNHILTLTSDLEVTVDLLEFERSNVHGSREDEQRF